MGTWSGNQTEGHIELSGDVGPGCDVQGMKWMLEYVTSSRHRQMLRNSPGEGLEGAQKRLEARTLGELLLK